MKSYERVLPYDRNDLLQLSRHSGHSHKRVGRAYNRWPEASTDSLHKASYPDSWFMRLETPASSYIKQLSAESAAERSQD